MGVINILSYLSTLDSTCPLRNNNKYEYFIIILILIDIYIVLGLRWESSINIEGLKKEIFSIF